MAMLVRIAKFFVHFVIWTASFISLAVFFGIASLFLYAFVHGVIHGLSFRESLGKVSLATCMLVSAPAYILSGIALWKIDRWWTERKSAPSYDLMDTPAFRRGGSDSSLRWE